MTTSFPVRGSMRGEKRQVESVHVFKLKVKGRNITLNVVIIKQ